MTDKNAYDEGLDNSDEENEEEEPSQEEADCGLLEASRTGNMEQIHFWLSKKGNPSFMKDGWNPLLWAACNGDEAVVRVLIKHGGCDHLDRKEDIVLLLIKNKHIKLRMKNYL